MLVEVETSTVINKRFLLEN